MYALPSSIVGEASDSFDFGVEAIIWRGGILPMQFVFLWERVDALSQSSQYSRKLLCGWENRTTEEDNGIPVLSATEALSDLGLELFSAICFSFARKTQRHRLLSRY